LKHRLARSLFLYGLCNGGIHEGTHIVEASSGSTAVSEAYFARLLGVPFIAVVPATTSKQKLEQIELDGGKWHLVGPGEDIGDASRRLADQTGGRFMDQFTYPNGQRIGVVITTLPKAFSGNWSWRRNRFRQPSWSATERAEPHVGESLGDSQFPASRRDAAMWSHRMNCDDVFEDGNAMRMLLLHRANAEVTIKELFYLILARTPAMRLMFIPAIVLCFGAVVSSEDALFSGPQVGEELVSFDAKSVLGDPVEQSVRVLETESSEPTLLVFVHQVTRPSIGLTRLLVNHANTKKQAGLKSHLVFLTADPTETEAWFRRARGALPEGVAPLISTDGIEGPGAYGLNRKMTLTILVAREGKVIANFPLIQPSIQSDGPKIGQAIEKALGSDKAPTLAEMGFQEPAMRARKGQPSPEQNGIYRSMMSPLIQKTATPDEVELAAQKIEEMASKTPWFRERIHQAANQIVGGDRLSNYGTVEAQRYLQKWGKEMSPIAKRDEAESK